eukprot:12920849-Prorocentrum_lima.AAC.1
MSDRVFGLATRLLLGQRVTSSQACLHRLRTGGRRGADCSEPLDPWGRHDLVCSRGGGHVERHNGLEAV